MALQALPRACARPFHTKTNGIALPVRPSRFSYTPRIATTTSRTHLTITAAATSNPAYTFGKVDDALSQSRGRELPMTTQGAVQKTGLLLLIATATAVATWMQIASGSASAAVAAMALAKPAGIVAMVTALATMFKPEWVRVTAPLYAASKGVALAAISAFFEMLYPGIAVNAVLLTFSTAASLIFAVSSGAIQVTDTFKDTVSTVTGGFFLFMLATWLLSMLGMGTMSMLSAGPIGWCVGLMSAGLAAANLLVDYQVMQDGARQGLPQWFEWYSAFSFMLTLVWMYTEILRLLAMFAGGNKD